MVSYGIFTYDTVDCLKWIIELKCCQDVFLKGSLAIKLSNGVHCKSLSTVKGDFFMGYCSADVLEFIIKEGLCK